jgi:hypothetical protein
MMRILRPLVALVAAFIAFFFVVSVLSIFTEQPDWISSVWSLPGAVVVGWFVWRSTARKTVGIGLSVLGGALILGGFGFVVGFVGPMIFAPGANQGPLLGLFITGPLGIIAGGIGGFVHWLSQNRNSRDGNSI